LAQHIIEMFMKNEFYNIIKNSFKHFFTTTLYVIELNKSL